VQEAALTVAQDAIRAVVVEHLDHVSSAHTEIFHVLRVELDVGNGVAAAYELVVLVLIRGLPDLVVATVVDPELVLGPLGLDAALELPA